MFTPLAYTTTVTCPGGETVTVGDESCTIADNGDGTSTITCDDGTTATIGNQICANTSDADLDGIPDNCAMNVLLATGYGSGDLQSSLEGWGFTVTTISGAALVADFDYSPYDVVAFMYDSLLASPANLLAQNVAKNVGIVVHRGDSLVGPLEMCASGIWQEGTFAITNNSHYISQPFAIGDQPLSYQYKSHCHPPAAGTITLGTSTGPSLVVHATERRVVTPYYGHTSGMPWNNEAAQITWRSYIWAAKRVP